MVDGMQVVAQIEAWHMVSLVVAIFGALAGVYGFCAALYVWAGRHIADKGIHMPGADLQNKEVCLATHVGLDKALDAQFDATNKRIDDLRDEMNRNFGDLKRMVLNGHNRNT